MIDQHYLPVFSQTPSGSIVAAQSGVLRQLPPLPLPQRKKSAKKEIEPQESDMQIAIRRPLSHSSHVSSPTRARRTPSGNVKIKNCPISERPPRKKPSTFRPKLELDQGIDHDVDDHVFRPIAAEKTKRKTGEIRRKGSVKIKREAYIESDEGYSFVPTGMRSRSNSPFLGMGYADHDYGGNAIIVASFEPNLLEEAVLEDEEEDYLEENAFEHESLEPNGQVHFPVGPRKLGGGKRGMHGEYEPMSPSLSSKTPIIILREGSPASRQVNRQQYASSHHQVEPTSPKAGTRVEESFTQLMDPSDHISSSFYSSSSDHFLVTDSVSHQEIVDPAGKPRRPRGTRQKKPSPPLTRRSLSPTKRKVSSSRNKTNSNRIFSRYSDGAQDGLVISRKPHQVDVEEEEFEDEEAHDDKYYREFLNPASREERDALFFDEILNTNSPFL